MLSSRWESYNLYHLSRLENQCKFYTWKNLYFLSDLCGLTRLKDLSNFNESVDFMSCVGFTSYLTSRSCLECSTWVTSMTLYQYIPYEPHRHMHIVHMFYIQRSQDNLKRPCDFSRSMTWEDFMPSNPKVLSNLYENWKFHYQYWFYCLHCVYVLCKLFGLKTLNLLRRSDVLHLPYIMNWPYNLNYYYFVQSFCLFQFLWPASHLNPD